MMDHKILLVEDNADDIELAMHGLRSIKDSCDIDVVENGEQALEYLDCSNTDRQVRPDLILLDIGLPGISGLDVLRKLRSSESCRKIPIIMLSSSDEEVDIVASYDLGANSYLFKPLKYSSFAFVMEQLGMYWLGAST